MDKEAQTNGPSASLIAGATAWTLLILVGAPLLVAMLTVNRDLYMWIFLVCLCASCLAYGGMIAEWGEGPSGSRFRFLLSLSALVVAVLGIIVPGRFSPFRGVPPVGLIVIAILLGPLAAPFIMKRVQRSQARAWPLIALGLVPGLLAGLALYSFATGALHTRHVSNILWMFPLMFGGPWATQVARLVDFPNAGEFFILPLALPMTAAMGALIYLYVSRPRWRAMLVVPYAVLAAVWVLVGFATLMNCMS